MMDRVYRVPADEFAAAWNAADSLDGAARRVRELAGGPAPRWAVLVRASALRAAGVWLKALPGEPTRGATA